MTIDPIVHDFSQPETIKELAEFIGVTVETIETVISELDQSKLYTQHKIPKKNNPQDTRIVWEIESQWLRDAHKYLQRRFEAFVREKTNYPGEHSHGYITGKSPRTNAAEHVKKRFILHADIKSFFPTITSTRLQNLFLTFGIKLNIAEILAKFLTINGSLALGLPCSPLLANLVCLNLDKSFAELAGKYACKFTRYADDITFSSDEKLPERIEIETILRDEGFTLAAEKFRITKIGQSHFVTGLSVSDDIPRIPRKIKRRIRQELRFAKKFGLNDHLGRIKENDIQQSVNRIDGTIHYINGVEPELAENLLEVWVSILAESETQPGYRQDANRKPRSIKMFFDSLEIETGSGKLVVLGCLTTQDLEGLNKESNEIIRQYSINPRLPGFNKELPKTGISYESVHDNLRTEYIGKLEYLPFRSFIAYDFLSNYSSRDVAYLSLLGSLLRFRMMTAEQAEVTIIFDEDPQISNGIIDTLVEKLYSSLEEKKRKRPAKLPDITHGKKNEHPGLSAINFVLNVFALYAELNSRKISNKKEVEGFEETSKTYERLRDKIRFIESKITGEIFVQRNAFTPWEKGLPDQPKTLKQINKNSKDSQSTTAVMIKEIIQKSPHTLIMKGGGVKGLAYVGAIRELEKYYNFNWFAGTSAGAIAASMLAIGYTANELEEELRNKDFKEFLDAGIFGAIWNILSGKGGFYQGRTFTTWLDRRFGRKKPTAGPLTFKEFPKRLTVYASRRYKEALIFDSKNDKEKSASFAVRCSMSIPIVFIPQREEGLRVYDGGMQNNYPVDKLLDINPNMKFVGLYLGNYYEGEAAEPSLLADIMHIFTEAVNVAAVERHLQDTVMIDPRPITTIDFWLSNEEKDFLVATGKVAALKFLRNKNLNEGPNQEDIDNAENELRDTAEKMKKPRKSRRNKIIGIEILLLIILLIIVGIILKFGGTILTIVLLIFGGIVLFLGFVIYKLFLSNLINDYPLFDN